MNQDERLRAIVIRGLNDIVSDDFKGYDPYDGCSTSYPLLQAIKSTRLFSQYFNKFSPINLRYLFGIEKQLLPQVLAYFGLIVFEFREEVKYKNDLDRAVQLLLNKSLVEKYGYHCWNSIGFPLQMRSGYSQIDTPDVVGGSIISSFLLKYYKRYKNEEVLDAIESQYQFFLNELLVDLGNEAFIKYRPDKSESVATYNASLLAARSMIHLDKYLGREIPIQIKKCFDFVVNRQQETGLWYYTINLNNGFEKKQVDFHQGFVLDCILDFIDIYGDDRKYLDFYRKGLKFFYEKQFLENGQGIYRYPRKLPVNIHNQSQGIITFSRAAKFNIKYLEFAKKIAEWTIKNMYDEKEGYFYYLKYPFFTNKIRYVRWSDMNMLLALAIFLNHSEVFWQ